MKNPWIPWLALGLAQALAGCGSTGGAKIEAAPQHDPPPAVKAEQTPVRAADVQLEVVTLEHAVADQLSRELTEVLEARRSGPPVIVVADARTNSLILKGSREDLAKVMALVAKLDVKQD